MTWLVNDAADFASEAVAGLVAAYPGHLRAVPGGVARVAQAPDGQVAVVVGGGSGHYPAFAGWVGPGLAHGAACGEVFASPAASRIYSVMKACDRGSGVVATFGNYAGDVLQFGLAADQLRAEGVDVRIVTINDDVASAAKDEAGNRRGIAGMLAVAKLTGAAAARGMSIDDVERVASKARGVTRTLGVAFTGCTLPGADHPLFTVPAGRMSIGLGVHGEPGIAEAELETADQTVARLWDAVVAEAPEPDPGRVMVMLNGLGAVKYEELFVAFGSVKKRLDARGYEVVQAIVGEQCTSLDMAGFSLTVVWLDDELADLWRDPCDSPSFSRGFVATDRGDLAAQIAVEESVIAQGGPASQALAGLIIEGLAEVSSVLEGAESRLGDLDAVAGDGDHGIGMLRGAKAALAEAEKCVAAGAGAASTLRLAGEAFAERSGGTSGGMWGAILTSVAEHFDDETDAVRGGATSCAREAFDRVVQLGGAEVGDKTMVDAFAPFVATLEAGGSWEEAVAAARTAADATAGFAARRGRARTHGDRSVGTPDPGAVSFALIVEALTGRVPSHVGT